MTVGKEVEAEILRLYYAEKWRPTTIAKQIGIHRSVVQRVLSNNGVSIEVLRTRSSQVDSWRPFIQAKLEQYPRLTAARLHEMLKQRGYSGCSSRFREVVAQMRPRPAAEAYMRTATLPGEQAQVDWAHFGRVKIGNAERRLLAFVMVLSWSRHIFLRFYTGDAMPNFLRGHADAFEFFGHEHLTGFHEARLESLEDRHARKILCNHCLDHWCSQIRHCISWRQNPT